MLRWNRAGDTHDASARRNSMRLATISPAALRCPWTSTIEPAARSFRAVKPSKTVVDAAAALTRTVWPSTVSVSAPIELTGPITSAATVAWEVLFDLCSRRIGIPGGWHHAAADGRSGRSSTTPVSRFVVVLPVDDNAAESTDRAGARRNRGPLRRSDAGERLTATAANPARPAVTITTRLRSSDFINDVLGVLDVQIGLTRKGIGAFRIENAPKRIRISCVPGRPRSSMRMRSFARANMPARRRSQMRRARRCRSSTDSSDSSSTYRLCSRKGPDSPPLNGAQVLGGRSDLVRDIGADI